MFKYTNIPFEVSSGDDSDSDNGSDDGFSIFNELAKSKGKGIKRRSKFKSSKKKKPSPSIFKIDSDDDESDMKNSSDEDGDGDGDEYDNDRKIDVKDTKKDITPAISKQMDDLIDEKAQKVIHSGVDSMDGISKKKSTAKIDLTLVEKETKMYQALLDRLSRPSTDEAIISTSSKFAISDVDIIARTRNRATSHSCLQNLPTVQTQLQRRQIASASLASCDIGGDVEGTVQGEVLNFVTKLNGNLIHHWQIGSKEPFTKMIADLRSMYGLGKAEKVIMMDPNGERVTDNNTPEEIEMEDGDQIDVSIADSLYQKAVSASEANTAQQKKTLSSANNGASNYVSSVSSLLAEQEVAAETNHNHNLDYEKPVADIQSIMCKIVVPGAFCQAGGDIVLPVKVMPSTTLRTVHDHIIQMPKLLKADNSESLADLYWYSYETSLEDRIDLDSTLGGLHSGSTDLLLILHKDVTVASTPSTYRNVDNVNVSSSSNEIIEIQVIDSTTDGSDEDNTLPMFKVKLQHRCQKLMTVIADKFLQVPLHELRFHAESPARAVELTPELSFRASGVLSGDIIRVTLRQ